MSEKKWTISQCLAYIDENLAKELTINGLAQLAGYSYKYFCHWFCQGVGMPIGEYLRKKRMYQAAESLSYGKRLDDVALASGFDTPSGFNKAFKREFQLSPSEYRQQFQKVKKPRFESRPALKCVCYSIPPFEGREWNPFTPADHCLEASLNMVSLEDYNKLTEAGLGEVGFWSDPAAVSGNRTYYFGAIVPDFSYVPPGMLKMELPAATYGVFTTIPVNIGADKYGFRQRVEDVKKYIYTVWFEDDLLYTIDEEKILFEYYAANSGGAGKSYPVEIYVPIKEK